MNIEQAVRDMIAAPSCYAGLKEKGEAWLSAKDEKTAKALIEEIEADITNIDGLVAFAESENAEKIFGADGVKGFRAHAKELKASGAKYCDCQACANGLKVLENKAALIG